ncbi:uncharacterized protein UTRI_00574_B [Ustilago trichophora]|uniref:RNA polymerase II-associated protein 1 C-terminal domain-containing protein n=1 Tax=Ustilago trichophora TaxID=86804 RepID=A0A5C3DQ23_9BASI|nr:uncharacterized protein UTRI_00574_B [Ustilago trichophora]
MASRPSMDEREMRKQQIRPRFLDLAEFDDDMPDSSRRAALGSFTDWPPAATVVRKKPPTIASSSKAEASAIQAESSASRKATVQDAEDVQAPSTKSVLPGEKAPQPPKQTPAQSQPRTVRFTPDTASANEDVAEGQSAPKAVLDFAGSIIGTIQERPVGERRAKSHGPSRSKPSGSRFVVRRRMDEDLQKHEEQRQQRLQAESTPQGQEPGTGFPEVHHRDQIAPILPPVSGKARQVQYSEDIETVEAPQRDTLATQAASGDARGVATSAADEEEWLDEDGKPMSAFRKSRLLRQGLRPPSVRTISNLGMAADKRQIPDFKSDPTRDPGGGADIDAITAVLSDVSRENDQKLRQMSAAEVSEEIRSLESLFGKDVLDALRNRKSGGTSKETKAAATVTSAVAAQSASKAGSNASASNWEAEEDGPLAIKRQYFPAEPEGPNPSLEWMMPQPSSTAVSTDLRFDFSGKIIQRGVQTDETYLSGLHHHGDDQEAPGYTFSELVHLSRSAVAAQRQLALNVLGRVCEQYPAFNASSGQPGASTAVELLNEHALLLRARVISISRWLLGDRHFTVRAAALRCLISAIRSLPAGVTLPLAAGQELQFHRLFATPRNGFGDKKDRAEASEVETSIQIDWANVMLESKILNLFLDKTDSVITSTWEAELALELLLRIASCSGAHASQIFEADPVQLCDFIIHLGLNVPWPPVPTDVVPASTASRRPSSLPSLTAVRLLHQGILSDRKIAESIVMSGSTEHLLRFVVTPPWRVEEDWASDDEEGDAIVMMAYQIFDEVLQLFTSLASYGFFASVVARTWNLWQESSTWALKQLTGGDTTKASASNRGWVDEARNTAAQRIFEILGAWTHCAMDPHELMTAHDITWTQVRDWIESVKDTASLLNGGQAVTRASTAAPAFGALCGYIDAWLRCAIGKESRLLLKYLESCKAFMSHCQQPIQQHFLQVLGQFSSAPTQAMALDEAEQACRACHRYLDLSETLVRAEHTVAKQAQTEKALVDEDHHAMLQAGLALISCGPLWQAVKSLESQASGRRFYQETFSNFVAAVVTAESAIVSDVALQLAAITRLDAHHTSRVAEIVMQATESLAGDSTAHVLRPFLLECIAGRNHLPEADKRTLGQRDSTPLSQVSSLFKGTERKDANGGAKKAECDADGGDEDEEEEEEEEEEKDVDPITSSKLWKCPASGLPLRADWTLLVLDDLLHSANTAVFNRPDNLETDWKPSELEMVRAALKLAVAVFRALLEASKRENASSDEAVKGSVMLQSRAMLCSLPSPEQIILGVMKVFMLEKDQPDTFTDKNSSGASQQKQTGVLTGRDLFRDSAVSSDLTCLLDIADELVELRQRRRHDTSMSTTTLEQWTSTTYGSSSMSSYQFFTDLVGLWDSVSFGDVNFARIVMTVANAGCGGGLFEGEDGVAVDFRRLVWNDYSDSLRSMPSTKVAKWLLSWEDTDADMLEHYCRYLAGAADASTARGSIAWQIAAHHVGAALKSLSANNVHSGRDSRGSQEKRIESILKSLVMAKGELLMLEILAASRSTLEEELQRLVERLSVSSAQS